MNIDERISSMTDKWGEMTEQQMLEHALGGNNFLADDVKQLIRDVIEEVTPRTKTEHEEIDARDNRPPVSGGWVSWGYNAAISELEASAKRLGLGTNDL